MANPRIGRASEERVASKKNLEALDDSPDRGHEALSPEETARREGEKAALLQRLGVPARAAEPTPTVGEAEQEYVTVAEGPTSAEINALLGRLDAEHDAAIRSAGESYEAQRTAFLAQRREAEDRES